MTEKVDGELLYHAECIGDDCTSSDGMAVYQKEIDGEKILDAYCFAVSYTHLTLPTIQLSCRSRWSPYH